MRRNSTQKNYSNFLCGQRMCCHPYVTHSHTIHNWVNINANCQNTFNCLSCRFLQISFTLYGRVCFLLQSQFQKSWGKSAMALLFANDKKGLFCVIKYSWVVYCIIEHWHFTRTNCFLFGSFRWLDQFWSDGMKWAMLHTNTTELDHRQFYALYCVALVFNKDFLIEHEHLISNRDFHGQLRIYQKKCRLNYACTTTTWIHAWCLE